MASHQVVYRKDGAQLEEGQEQGNEATGELRTAKRERRGH